MKIYSYNPGSKSAKALADALGIKRINHEGPMLKRKVGDYIINWGSSNFTRAIQFHREGPYVLNSPHAVANASNKLTTFKILTREGVSVPEWTEDMEVAKEWVRWGHQTVARAKLNGHSGEGITIYTKEDDQVDLAPLYTRYIKKKEEYRIHVFQGEAFFVQRKARKMDVPVEEVNWQVRNLAGGFIFANKDVEVDDVARVQAVNAVACLGLDFGAVDIILGSDGKFYVLEVNTACGLEGTTLEKYVEQFQKFR